MTEKISSKCQKKKDVLKNPGYGSLCEKCLYLEFFGPYSPAFGLNTEI